MAKRQKYSVPFITETIEIFEVEAVSGNEATMLADRLRQAGGEATHSRISRFKLGTVKPTVAEDVTTPDPTRDPRRDAGGIHAD